MAARGPFIWLDDIRHSRIADPGAQGHAWQDTP